MAFTYAQLAKKFGVSTSLIGHWKDLGCPVKGTLAEIKKWRDLNEAANPRKQGPAADPVVDLIKKGILKEEWEERKERRQLVALRRMEKDKSLVPIEQALDLIVKMGSRARSAALNLPKSAAKRFVGIKSANEAEKRLDAFVREVLASMASAPAKGEE